jgi:hypothetical protein
MPRFVLVYLDSEERLRTGEEANANSRTSQNAVTPTLVKPRTRPAQTAQETPKGSALLRGIRWKMKRLRPGRA